MQITSLSELKKIAKQSGVKVYAYVALTNDDSILVEVKKSDFLAKIAECEDEFFGENSRVSFEDGNIIFG